MNRVHPVGFSQSLRCEHPMATDYSYFVAKYPPKPSGPAYVTASSGYSCPLVPYTTEMGDILSDSSDSYYDSNKPRIITNRCPSIKQFVDKYTKVRPESPPFLESDDTSDAESLADKSKNVTRKLAKRDKTSKKRQNKKYKKGNSTKDNCVSDSSSDDEVKVTIVKTSPNCKLSAKYMNSKKHNDDNTVIRFTLEMDKKHDVNFEFKEPKEQIKASNLSISKKNSSLNDDNSSDEAMFYVKMPKRALSAKKKLSGKCMKNRVGIVEQNDNKSTERKSRVDYHVKEKQDKIEQSAVMPVDKQSSLVTKPTKRARRKVVERNTKGVVTFVSGMEDGRSKSCRQRRRLKYNKVYPGDEVSLARKSIVLEKQPKVVSKVAKKSRKPKKMQKKKATKEPTNIPSDIKPVTLEKSPEQTDPKNIHHKGNDTDSLVKSDETAAIDSYIEQEKPCNQKASYEESDIENDKPEGFFTDLNGEQLDSSGSEIWVIRPAYSKKYKAAAENKTEQNQAFESQSSRKVLNEEQSKQSDKDNIEIPLELNENIAEMSERAITSDNKLDDAGINNSKELTDDFNLTKETTEKPYYECYDTSDEENDKPEGFFTDLNGKQLDSSGSEIWVIRPAFTKKYEKRAELEKENTLSEKIIKKPDVMNVAKPSEKHFEKLAQKLSLKQKTVLSEQETVLSEEEFEPFIEKPIMYGYSSESETSLWDDNEDEIFRKKEKLAMERDPSLLSLAGDNVSDIDSDFERVELKKCSGTKLGTASSSKRKGKMSSLECESENTSFKNVSRKKKNKKDKKKTNKDKKAEVKKNKKDKEKTKKDIKADKAAQKSKEKALDAEEKSEGKSAWKKFCKRAVGILPKCCTKKKARKTVEPEAPVEQPVIDYTIENLSDYEEFIIPKEMDEGQKYVPLADYDKMSIQSLPLEKQFDGRCYSRLYTTMSAPQLLELRFTMDPPDYYKLAKAALWHSIKNKFRLQKKKVVEEEKVVVEKPHGCRYNRTIPRFKRK